MEKSKIYENYFYNQYSNTINAEVYYKDFFIYTDKSIGDLFNNLNRNIKILDLGCGFGGFANFCNKKGFLDYTGVDLSCDELEIARKKFPNYNFEHKNLFEFLNTTNDNTYDIVFLSMVFEHLTLEEGSNLVEIIYNKLKRGGVFINYQPNADSYFNSVSTLFIDITHERLYNINSYRQICLTKLDSKFDLQFRNSYIGRNIFFNTLHKTTKFFFEIFLRLMGYDVKPIYTKSFYSILKKL